ncbi:hypothetical protein [Mycobacterium sp. 29Ha]|jgi:hypothetical protein|uniref:hypothetical protein n=1 Tax=Mycobacterium sp. 29Ha TaxID=2939268 RepID=UPI0029390EEA|nr:hypothetical protein [Mycobacterium sp. 29Ha]MDV3132920.1 hypothetical protein [Mycobacterium sp. 29Ha]
MSGFDTSQPITDEASLQGADAEEQQGKTSVDQPSKPATPEELGDATPGPR